MVWPRGEFHGPDNWLSAITWGPSGEIGNVETHPDHRRRGLATQLFDYVKQNHRPDLRHSPTLSEDGKAWSRYEQSRTAARTAMPTWYHLTNDPDFKLDPSKHPNRPYGLGQWHEPGVFLTQRPGDWAYSEDDDSWSGDRPYIADIDAPDDLHDVANTWYDPDGDRPGDPFPGSEETFVPADQFHHLTVQQVRPRKAKL
jgi:hypothetical protein